MSRIINSLQNPLIKRVALLTEKARERKRQQTIVAEGLREVGLALKAGFQAEYLFYDETCTSPEALDELLALAIREQGEVVAVSTAVMEKIAYRAGVPNVVALLQRRDIRLSEIQLSPNPLVLVLETVEKPGNLGAMLRTADAAGADAVIVCDPMVDEYNPNVIRSSLGAIFSVKLVTTEAQPALDWLHRHGIQVLSTYLDASVPYYSCDLRRPTAFVMGSEAHGISDFWVREAQQRIIIPMQGEVDSLNVSASAAIVLFEALRQRT
ncbi:MAG: TrmH family RNA methyltransferase [Haliscomenobacter sp.]